MNLSKWHIYISLLCLTTFGITYGAWNTPVSTWDSLSADSWNDVVSRVDTLDSNLSFSGGFLWIGTNNPEVKLTVQDGRIFQRTVSDTNHSIWLFNDTSNTGWQMYHLSSTDLTPNGFLLESFDGTDYIRRFSISETGDVWIGTASPIGNLQIQDQSDNSTVMYVGWNANGIVNDENGIGFTAYNDGNNYIDFKTSSAGGKTFFRTWKGTESWASKNVLTIDWDNGNIGVGKTPEAKLDVNGWIHTQSGKVQRDFLTWSTTIGSPGVVHIKTNIPIHSNIMYRILLEGYNYGSANPINSEAVWYSYSASSCLINDTTIDHASWVTLTQYCSSDGFITLKLVSSSMYYVGFSASAWFTNPAWSNHKISSEVFHQTADL